MLADGEPERFFKMGNVLLGTSLSQKSLIVQPKGILIKKKILKTKYWPMYCYCFLNSQISATEHSIVLALALIMLG